MIKLILVLGHKTSLISILKIYHEDLNILCNTFKVILYVLNNTLFDQFILSVDIILTGVKHLHGRIISLIGWVQVYGV